MPDTDTTVADVTMSVTQEPQYAPGEHYLLAPNSTTEGGGGVYFGNDEPMIVTVSDYGRDADDSPNVRGWSRRDERPSTQFVARRFLTPVPVRHCPFDYHPREQHLHFDANEGTDVLHGALHREPTTVDGFTPVIAVFDRHVPAPEPEPEWAPGYRYRVTNANGGHEFPVGTIVTALDSVTHHLHRGPERFHATILPTAPPYPDLPQQNGQTAWVGTYRDNVERVLDDAPEVVSRIRDTNDIRVGDVYRVTDTRGGHGFPVGTEVQVAREESGDADRPYENSGDYTSVYATTSDVLDGPTWEEGVTAWVVVQSNSGYQTVNAEFIRAAAEPEPEPTPAELPPPEEVLRLIREDAPDDWAAEITTIEGLLARIVEARTAVDAARMDRAQWLDRLIDRSREVADDNDWCEVYDRAMEELGLPSRGDREPDTEEVTVTANAEVTVSFDEDHFESWFSDHFDTTDFASINSHSTSFTVNLSLSTTVDVEEGECGCDHDIDWDGHLPSWVTDNSFDWDITETECSND